MADLIELDDSELKIYKEIQDPKSTIAKLRHKKGLLTKIRDSFENLKKTSLFKVQIPKLEGILTCATKAVLQYEAIYVQHSILTRETEDSFECAMAVHEREDAHDMLLGEITNHIELAHIARDCKCLELKSSNFDGIESLKAILTPMCDLQESISKLNHHL